MLLAISHFHSVFKRLVSQGHQKVSLCGNGLSPLLPEHGVCVCVRVYVRACMCVCENNCLFGVEQVFNIFFNVTGASEPTHISWY